MQSFQRSLRVAFPLSLAGMLGACVSPTMPLQTQDLNEFEGEAVNVRQETLPTFVASTPGNAAFGLVGALVSFSEGNELVAKNHISDPAGQIGQSVSQRLMTEYGAVSGQTMVADDYDRDPEDIVAWAEENEMTGLLVDVESTGWGFRNPPFSFSTYQVMYSGLVRVYDLESGSVIAQHHCNLATPGETGYDDLVDDQAAGIKSRLADLADLCANEVFDQALQTASLE
ncbi:MAG: hypothetical protein AAF530_16835 [Pseudomonadota bacterium]